MAWKHKRSLHGPRAEKPRRPYERASEKRLTEREHLSVHEPDVHHVGARNDHRVKRARE